MHRAKGLFLSIYIDHFRIFGREENIAPMWRKLGKNIDLQSPTELEGSIPLGIKHHELPAYDHQVRVQESRSHAALLLENSLAGGDSRGVEKLRRSSRFFQSSDFKCGCWGVFPASKHGRVTFEIIIMSRVLKVIWSPRAQNGLNRRKFQHRA